MRRLASLVLLFAGPAFADELTAKVSKDAITFHFGKELVTTYHTGATVAKPYFWPLNALGGVPVTRAWPMGKGVKGETTDHVHQKSAWFCHGDVIPVGMEVKVRSADKRVEGVDFWSEAKGHGVIACVEVGEPKAVSKTAVRVPTRNEWRTADGVKILDESRAITVTKLEAGYLIALDVVLTASACDIQFGDTKEGSMGVRVPDSFRTSLKDGGTVTSADGVKVAAGTKDNLPLWGKSADWHDYSGKVGDVAAGLAVFDAPTNKYRAYWHTRAYGLMAANPFARGKSGFPGQKGKTDLVTLKKGEELPLRYAIYAHTGDAKAGQVAQAYAGFVGK